MLDDPYDVQPESVSTTQSFVVRCRVESYAGGEMRQHFVLEEVGTDSVWRHTDIEAFMRKLRSRLTRLCPGSSVTNSKN